MLFRYYNNEDAGDLRAQHDADHAAAMAEARADELQARFQAEFDADGGGVCEECGYPLTRDSDAMYYERDGVYLHDACADDYINRPGYSEGREFPTYG